MVRSARSVRDVIHLSLRRLLHDRSHELALPQGCLDRRVWLDRLSGRLGRAPQDADVRVMRAQVRRLKQLAREASTVEGELLMLVRDLQPRLLALPGVGALTAAPAQDYLARRLNEGKSKLVGAAVPQPFRITVFNSEGGADGCSRGSG